MIKNSILHRLSEFLVGLLFGLGLILSGMTDPGKVTGFLDLFGLWDPSLALVMGGAIAVGFFAFMLAKKRTTNFFGGMLRQVGKGHAVDGGQICPAFTHPAQALPVRPANGH